MTPGARHAAATLGAIYTLKGIALGTRRCPGGKTGLALFLFAWPGVIPDCFRERRPAQSIEPGEFLGAWFRMAARAASILLLAVYASQLSDTVLGLAGIAALLLTLHLGIAGVLPWLVRWVGFSAPILFRRPWAATSL